LQCNLSETQKQVETDEKQKGEFAKMKAKHSHLEKLYKDSKQEISTMEQEKIIEKNKAILLNIMKNLQKEHEELHTEVISDLKKLINVTSGTDQNS